MVHPDAPGTLRTNLRLTCVSNLLANADGINKNLRLILYTKEFSRRFLIITTQVVLVILLRFHVCIHGGCIVRQNTIHSYMDVR